LSPLVTLAQDFSFLAPVAGTLWRFFERFQTLSSNKVDFQELKEDMELTAKLFSDTGMQNLMKNSQSDTLNSYFKQFNKSVYEINTLMTTIENRDRLKSKGFFAVAKDFIMAEKDKERIKDTLSRSKEARLYILGMLTAKKTLDENSDEGMLSKLYEYLLRPGTFDDVAEIQQKKFRKGSRSWLFEEFDAWFDDPKVAQSVFWLQAGPGMGKTVFTSELARRFIEKRPGALLGVVFFNFQEVATRDPATLLKSIVYQTAKLCPSICSDLLKKLNEINETTVEGIYDIILLKALELVVSKQPSEKQHLIIFDALDECGLEEDKNRKDLLKLFKKKLLRNRLPGVKIFVSGRPEKDIIDTLNECSHKIEGGDPRHLEDLKEYILFSVQDVFDATNAVNDAASIISINEAVDLIYRKSDQKFIYTAVVVDQIRDWFRNHDFSWMDFKSKLSELPQGLDDCYEKTFTKFIGSNPGHAHNFLLLMVGCSEQPLSSNYLVSNQKIK